MINKFFRRAIVAFGVFCSVGSVAAQSTAGSTTQGASSPSALVTPQARGPNAIDTLSKAAQDAGVRSCRPLADRVNQYLIGNAPSSGVLFAAPENANARVFSSMVELESGQGVTYVSANFAPYGDSGCGVAYDAVTYWPESCADVATKVLKELRPMGTLGKGIAMLDGGPAMRMFLMPAGTGCVQIKKELVYLYR